MTRRSIFGVIAALFAGAIPRKASSQTRHLDPRGGHLSIKGDNNPILFPLKVGMINGHAFPFIWKFEAGDKVTTRQLDGIHGLFVAREYYDTQAKQRAFQFAWSFHREPTHTIIPVGDPNRFQYMMELSLRCGHRQLGRVKVCSTQFTEETT